MLLEENWEVRQELTNYKQEIRMWISYKQMKVMQVDGIEGQYQLEVKWWQVQTLPKK